MATRNAGGDGAGAVATGGGTEPMTRPAAVHPNASSHTRPDVPPMLLGKLAVAAPGPACPENTAEVPARDLCTRSPRDLVRTCPPRKLPVSGTIILGRRVRLVYRSLATWL